MERNDRVELAALGSRAVPSVSHSCVKVLHKIWIWSLLALTGLAAGGAEPERVRFIHSFGRGFEPYHTVAGAFRTELASQMAEPIDFFEVSLESARFTDFNRYNGI